MYGFGFIWESQGVQNVEVFIKELNSRLEDCYIQNWKASKAETEIKIV